MKEADGQMKLTRVDKGTFEFYIMDENGKFALPKKSVPNIKLCKSWQGGGGGYFGEVPKAGTYTLVIWFKGGPVKNVVFGNVIDINLDPSAFGIEEITKDDVKKKPE